MGQETLDTVDILAWNKEKETGQNIEAVKKLRQLKR
jgi:hypothetical protein